MENIFPYANGLLPNLFTETNELVDKYRKIISSWKFLHAGEVENLKQVFQEEVYDVQSLGQLMEREYPHVRIPEAEKVAEATKISQLAELHAVYFQKQVSEVLRMTSLGSTFFAESLAYLEAYEQNHGFSPFPPDDQLKLFAILKMDFGKFNARLEGLKASFKEQILPIDQKIRIHMNIESRGYEEEKAALAEHGMPFELGRYMFIRSVKAESYRKVLREFFRTFEGDFSAISRRAFSHRIDISIIQSLK